MLIGATMNIDDLATYGPMLAGNNIMRIFPNTAQVDGQDAKVLPDWTDTRFGYCRQAGAIPFVSTKVDGNLAAIDYVRKQLMTMPDWIGQLYITDRHEPEGDVTAEAFRTNFTLFLSMIDALPVELRARVRCGPVLTRTWTEKEGPAAGLKPGRSYDWYDPGIGDFFGVDMYVQSGTAKSVVSPETLPDPKAFTAAFRGYRKSAADHRDRLWPELGLIGMPDDPDGTARAAWIRAVYAEVKSWDPAELGWKFTAMIWWNSTGKATGQVAQIGQRRDFPLHLRTDPGAGSPTAVTLPGSPPAPVAAFNDLFAGENVPATDAGQQPSDAPTAGTYQDGWRDGREHLLKQIAGLVAAPPAT